MQPIGGSTPIRTKLVATLGPATAEEALLFELLDRGVDVCRLNFSHGSLDTHQRNLDRVRAWGERTGRAVAVLGDLCGPKIRLNHVDAEHARIAVGQTVRVIAGEGVSSADQLEVSYDRLLQEVEVGHRIYIDDGLVRLLVTDRSPSALICTCTVGGRIADRKGVNLPDSRLSTPALTPKDRDDLRWAIENKLDYVALSFVRHPDDLRELRDVLERDKSDIQVICKIEKVEALEYLDDIIALSDGVMVARGDLGVEMDVWQVPLMQKAITQRCRQLGKPVIIATQMMQTMVQSPVPTRAEVSDVANAILDQADAVMLSAETAAGEFPAQVVAMMCRIAQATEGYQAEHATRELAPSISAYNHVLSALARAAVEAALTLDARLVIVWSNTGESVKLVAKHRLHVPVVGVTNDPATFRRLALVYGVVPMLIEPTGDPAELVASLDQELVQRGLVRQGDMVVVLTSTHPTIPGTNDTTLVHRIQTR